MLVYRHVWKGTCRALCICRAHTCGYDLVHGFVRSAGAFVALQASREGNLCLAVAKYGGQVVSASAQPFCSAPDILSLILFAPSQLSRTPVSWPSQSPVSISAQWLGADVVVWCWAKQELSFSPAWLVLSCWDVGHGTHSW